MKSLFLQLTRTSRPIFAGDTCVRAYKGDKNDT